MDHCRESPIVPVIGKSCTAGGILFGHAAILDRDIGEPDHNGKAGAETNQTQQE
ncbi:MAG: hypothetical protein M0Q91_10465 [Methanoregula sp.]|jgi:hypothetical protein|nr:hypothetical protein [Methanoregula sp.]